MIEERKFFEDIMIQTFALGTFYNPTRFVMLYGMLSSGKFKKIYTKMELVDYIFRAYCANKGIASHHPKIEIRKVPFFGIDIFYKELEEALIEWMHDSKNNILTFDSKNVYLNIDDNGYVTEYVEKILKVLFPKYFGVEYHTLESIDDSLLLKDKDLNIFGKSFYRDIVLADMQYCVLCDDCNVDNLYAVHIVNSDDTNDINTLSDKNNGLIMCKQHAEEFNNKEILLEDRGKFIFLNSSEMTQNMRLPSKIYLSRKEYIIKKNKKP